MKNNIVFIIFLVITTLLMVACGRNVTNRPRVRTALGSGAGAGSGLGTGQSLVQSSSYSYVMCVNCANSTNNCETDLSRCDGGCTTGAHLLTTLSELCTALQSQSLNNNCLTEDRKDLFVESGCSGTFTAH